LSSRHEVLATCKNNNALSLENKNQSRSTEALNVPSAPNPARPRAGRFTKMYSAVVDLIMYIYTRILNLGGPKYPVN
jgi:hypothetical protein